VHALHSGLAEAERSRAWLAAARGEAAVILGTRSAIFAPLPRLGLIAVDEEHDASYKQEESPRYHGRDVAIVRGQRAGALVVLGSATPSMESHHHAVTGRYTRIVLERRVHDRPLPAVTIVDMRTELAEDGPDVIVGRALQAGLRDRLARKEQALVLLNRRGFAISIFCRQCGGTLDCPNCSVSLVIHGQQGRRRARCHYCDFSMTVPASCPACAAPYLEQMGYGTERVEAEIKRVCPGARVSRLDRDAVRRRGALIAVLSRFASGEIDILVGTQMIAKGHDFPRVTLVGVVSADVGLGMADFRAAERTFQLLTQVAGRAGRGDRPGEAIVQTLYPNHYSIECGCRQDFATFAERERAFRKAMRYPPFAALVNVVVRDATPGRAMNRAQALADGLRDAAGEGLVVLGPAPAPLARLRGEYRAQVLLKGSNRRQMREAIRRVLGRHPDIARRSIVDVDPLSVL
jgi:primosomal protein N' (replication factor Y)